MLDKYLNKITCGDSYELIKEIPDKSVDLIITEYKNNRLNGIDAHGQMSMFLI